jgi:hypothetical protein
MKHGPSQQSTDGSASPRSTSIYWPTSSTESVNRRHSSLAGKHETDPEMRKFVAAFEQGMRAAGWIRGVNVR